MPTATAQTLTDEDSNPIMRTGHTKADGTFSINFLSPDTYTLGFENEIEIADHVLTLTVAVLPADASVGAGVTVDGRDYTITGATCVP